MGPSDAKDDSKATVVDHGNGKYTVKYCTQRISLGTTICTCR